jgi:GT2 family glycosyltransferase
MRASVVIVSRDEGALVARTVGALTAAMPPDTEVVVVDDDSSDGSVDTVRELWPDVRVLRNSPRLGVARARNAGAAAVTGDLLVFSDAHVAPTDGWLSLLADAASGPGVGAVGPSLTHLSGRSGAGRGLTWINAALNLRWLGRGGQAPLPVPLLCGCFMMVRRDAFERAGGFDERFAPYGGEDVEFCVRLWRLGLECVVEPRAVVAHRFRRPGVRRVPVEDRLYNLLRIGELHFGPQQRRALRRVLGRGPAFAAADARLADSDAAARRAALDAAAAVDTDWFFERFDLTFFGDGA